MDESGDLRWISLDVAEAVSAAGYYDAVPWEPLHTTSQPQALGSSLDALLRRFGGPTARTVTDIFEQWSTVVGTRVANQCQPLRIDGDTLVVGVDDAAWASEIKWMTADLLGRIHAHTESTSVQQIRVMVTPTRS